MRRILATRLWCNDAWLFLDQPGHGPSLLPSPSAAGAPAAPRTERRPRPPLPSRSVTRYLEGVLVCVALLAPLAAGAVNVRRRALPTFAGAPARLAEAVIGLGALLLTLEVLGVADLLRPVAFVLAGPAVGALGIAWGRRGGADAAADRKGPVALPSLGPVAAALAGLAVCVIAGIWVAEAQRAYAFGITALDSVWYHLPFAARYARDHAITGIAYLDVDGNLVSFYPGGAELLHAAGMVAFARDFLSVGLNFAWLGLGALAAWCIGRPRGAGAASLLGAMVVLALPTLAQGQAGTAANDVMATALLLSAVALVVNADGETAPLALAGLACGLAIGTKLSLLVPGAALCLAAVAAEPRARRLRLTGVLAMGLVAGGGYWYVRNLVSVGNPFPFKALGPLPAPPLPHPSAGTTLAQALAHSGTWGVLAHGAVEGLGRIWPVVLVVGIGSLAATVALGATRRERLIGAAGLLAAAAYLVTPGGAAGPSGDPVQFSLNLRYLAPALALGFVLLPRLPPLAAGRAPRWWTLGALGVVFALTQRHDLLRPPSYANTPLVAVLVLAGVVAAAVATARRRPPAAALAAGALVLVLALILVGRHAETGYAAHRYLARGTLGPRVAALTRTLRHTRIGITGTFAAFTQYWLYGPDGSNHVTYLAHRGPHGRFDTYRTCAGYRTAVDRSHARYVLVTPHIDIWSLAPHRSPEYGWLRAGGARLVLRDGVTAVYAVTRPLTPCRA